MRHELRDVPAPAPKKRQRQWGACRDPLLSRGSGLHQPSAKRAADGAACLAEPRVHTQNGGPHRQLVQRTLASERAPGCQAETSQVVSRNKPEAWALLPGVTVSSIRDAFSQEPPLALAAWRAEMR